VKVGFRAMADPYRVAVIGAGRPWGTEGAAGWGMAHVHLTPLFRTARDLLREGVIGELRRVEAACTEMLNGQLG
jgi:hypothetical protein